MDLAEAITYLTNKHTERPLWKGKRQRKGGLEEPPHPLYPALSNSEKSFITTLGAQYHEWVRDNDKKKPVKVNAARNNNDNLDYPTDFLNYFARRLNIPDVPPRYGLLTNSDIPSSIINRRIPKGVKAIEEKIHPIGVVVLGKNRKETIAFPVAFLETLQRVITKDSSLKGDHLIAEAVLEYMKYLDALEITKSCIGVSSLELENLRAFLTNRDSLLASAGQ
jgi:hypothetical protein